MAIIYTFPKKASPTSADLVVISDVADGNKTKQSTISDIGDAITKVDSIIAGPGIDISASTGNVTISNIGILTVTGSVNPFITTTAVTVNGDVTVGAALSATGTPSSSKYLRGDNTWATPAGAGTVTEVSSSSSITALSLTTLNPTDTPSITLAKSGGTAGQYLDGTGNWSVPSGGGTMDNWEIEADSGGATTIADGDTVTIEGGDAITTSNSSGTITIDNGGVTEITVGGGLSVDTGTGVVDIENIDRGSAQNIFKTVAVSGQPSVVANVNSDTLTLVAGTGMTLTTDAAGQSVEFEATAASTPTTGWNPINIPSGTGFDFTAGESVMLQVVAEATFICNKMKFMAEYGTGSGGPVMRFDIYQGQLIDPNTSAPNGFWIGGGLGPGSPTATNGGIIDITIVGEDPVQIIAGQNYVLYFRTSGGTYNVLSADQSSLQDPGIAVGGNNGGSLLTPLIDLGSEITAKGFNQVFEDARKRPCCHLYSV